MTATPKEQREELARLLDERDSHQRKDDWVTSLAKAEEAQRKAYHLLPALLADAERCAELEAAVYKHKANHEHYKLNAERFEVGLRSTEAKLKIAVEALEAGQAWIADGGHAEDESGRSVYLQITDTLAKIKGDELPRKYWPIKENTND